MRMLCWSRGEIHAEAYCISTGNGSESSMMKSGMKRSMRVCVCCVGGWEGGIRCDRCKVIITKALGYLN